MPSMADQLRCFTSQLFRVEPMNKVSSRDCRRYRCPAELESAHSLCLSSRSSRAHGVHWIFAVVKMRRLRRENGFAELPRVDVRCTGVDGFGCD